MVFHTSRKASLDLSVNSIVVMVIAFVVLGLILSFTRGIFSFGQGQLSQIVNVVDLTEKPTSENPITPRSFTLSPGQPGKQTPMGFYNTGSTQVTDLDINFDSCIGSPSDTSINAPPLSTTAKPDLQMIKIKSVDPSKAAAFTALISNPTAGGLPGGNYVCSLITDKSIGSAPLSVQVSITVG